MSEPLLRLEGIRHRYAGSEWELAIERFALAPGEFVGVIGPNGSGKSTLLRIAAGALLPAAGRVWLDGKELSGLERRAVARRLGYLPQEAGSAVEYTVAEVVELGRYPHSTGFGRLGARDHAVVEEALARTEMSLFRHRPLSRLSGGERKRAFLASVLAQEPAILLLDEPTAALDLHHQVHFFQILRELSDRGMGVAAVTHDINFAALFCDRVLLLKNGSPLAEGRPGRALAAETLQALYGDEILLGRHPEADCPSVLPRRKSGARP